MILGFVSFAPAAAAGSYYVIPYYDCTWSNLTDPYLNPSICNPTIQLTPNETHIFYVYAEGLAPTYTSISGLQINWTISDSAGGSFSSLQTVTDVNGSTTNTFTAGTTGYYIIQAASNDGNIAEFSVNIGCLAGYYDNGSGCVAADPGHFVAVTGSIEQSLCAPGTYQPSSGAISCLLADAGYYVDTSGAVAETLCPTGYISDAGAVACYLINTPPSVDANGPYSGFEGTPISIGGATASDSDSDPLSYAWSINSASCSFSDTNILNPILTCYETGSFTVTLSVSDGVNPAVTSDAAVNVSAPTPASLSTLVSDYVNKSGVALSLKTKLNAVQWAIGNDNLNAKAGAVKAFINEVNAQSGKSIPTSDAAILIALAHDL